MSCDAWSCPKKPRGVWVLPQLSLLGPYGTDVEFWAPCKVWMARTRGAGLDGQDSGSSQLQAPARVSMVRAIPCYRVSRHCPVSPRRWEFFLGK